MYDTPFVKKTNLFFFVFAWRSKLEAEVVESSRSNKLCVGCWAMMSVKRKPGPEAAFNSVLDVVGETPKLFSMFWRERKEVNASAPVCSSVSRQDIVNSLTPNCVHRFFHSGSVVGEAELVCLRVVSVLNVIVAHPDCGLEIGTVRTHHNIRRTPIKPKGCVKRPFVPLIHLDNPNRTVLAGDGRKNMNAKLSRVSETRCLAGQMLMGDVMVIFSRVVILVPGLSF